MINNCRAFDKQGFRNRLNLQVIAVVARDRPRFEFIGGARDGGGCGERWAAMNAEVTGAIEFRNLLLGSSQRPFKLPSVGLQRSLRRDASKTYDKKLMQTCSSRRASRSTRRRRSRELEQ